MIAQIGPHRVRVRGRTVADGGMLWLASSLSEAAFRVTGARRLEIALRADDSVSDPNRAHLTPRYEVLLDGKTAEDRRMQAEEETVAVFSSDQPRDAVVRFRKLSECTQSLLAIREIRTDGKTEPLPEQGMRVEFIGDSMTCGYGVEAKDALEGFSTATENAGKSYAGLLAEEMGLDAMLTCFSGHGIVSGYTADPEKRNVQELVPPYYRSAGRNGFRLPSGRKLEDIPWDFSAWQPEKILINLGTNDLSWCGDREERKLLYRREYVKFLAAVREKNPGAAILCVLGFMGTGLNSILELAVGDYRAESGDSRVYVRTLRDQDGARCGYGADYHPSARSQRELAAAVREWLENI